MNQSDELCLSYFANWQKIKELTQEMWGESCQCPRTNEQVPGHPDNVFERQRSHIDVAWEAVKDGGYDSDEAKEYRAEVDACPQCSRFQSLVDERKALRRGLGAIKSAICKRGRRLEAESKVKP